MPTPTKTLLTQNQNIGGQNPLDGINCDVETALKGTCTVNVDKILGVRQDSRQSTPSDLIQDLVLGGTFFIGTVLTIVVVRAGFLRVQSGLTGDDSLKTKAKKGIIGAIIGFVLVATSYAIVRLVQFLARGG